MALDDNNNKVPQAVYVYTNIPFPSELESYNKSISVEESA